MCMAGLQRRSVAASGDTAALPAMARTCLSSQGTPSIRAATGWVAKPLSVCRRDRHGRVNLPTTGRLAIGSVSTTPTPILAALAQLLSMYQELHLRSLCSRWAKIATPICSTATISAVFPVPRTRRMWAGSTEEHQLSLITPVRERTLAFTTMRVPSGPTELLQRVHQR
jgi:hypothetical protein